MTKTDKEKLDYLKQLIPNANNIELMFALGKTEELIKNYTNVSRLPKSIFYTHIEMAMLYYQYHNKMHTTGDNDGSEDDTVTGKVKSIQEGDTTVTMASASESENSTDKAINKRMFEDKLLHDFRIPLHRIRKMRW